MSYYEDARAHVRFLGAPRPQWRTPQVGGLAAAAMHWSLSPTVPTVVSIPTGSGKTAIAMAVPHILEAVPRRVLVVAPTRALREQLSENFATNDVLRRIGAMPSATEYAGVPNVVALTGRVQDWASVEDADVVVALPNSISPQHYDDHEAPPKDLFDLVIIDEAHHAPAPTWTAILDHFSARHALLLTATPVRRDGKRIPGELVYHYPLRQALAEGFYQPVRPVLLDLSDPADRAAADRSIARNASGLLADDLHQSSVLLVRAGSVERLESLKAIYQEEGVSLTLLHNRLSNTAQRGILRGLVDGHVRAVAVVGMLGEGFDLPSLRIAAYHDKHKSLPATIQLIGRLARVHPDHPQGSVLVTARDIDVFPELRGIVRSLYDEDADWAEVLPGIIDDQIEQEREQRAFAAGFGTAPGEIQPDRLRPLERSIVYEISDTTWRPPFDNGQVPPNLHEGEDFLGGRIVYTGVDPDGQLLVVGVQHLSQPKWTTDPGLAETTYSLHLIAFRPAPRVDVPSLLFINTDGQAGHTALRDIFELDDVGQPASPERIGQYIDGLDRRSVSAVGMRSTNAANRGTTSYKNHLGAGVDRGLRAVDMTRNALGHVNIQTIDSEGSSNAGAALEKAKLWVTRYVSLRAYDGWIERTATLLWFERTSVSGPLLPALNRGARLVAWPPAMALAAEMNPALLGRGLQIVNDAGELVSLEDVELFVAGDPLGTVDGQPTDEGLPIAAVWNDRASGSHAVLWRGTFRIDGSLTGPPLLIRHGHIGGGSITDILDEFPPTIYFLDGTTVVGRVAYTMDRLGPSINPDSIISASWAGVDITAETADLARSRGNGDLSVHEALVDWLAGQPRRGLHRWIILNDGSGEIADILVVEPLVSGEVHLGLWHAKAAGSPSPGRRINELQVVVAQAIRCRRWFPSLNLWPELALRLAGQRKPEALLQTGSDDHVPLFQRLGLEAAPNEEFVSWQQRPPVIRGQIGVVQPGLSRSAALSEPHDGSEAGVLELLTVLEDTGTADGHHVVVLGSA